MKKSQIIIGIIFFLLVGVFVTNWYYGEQAEQVVIEEMKKFETRETVYIDYNDISVNPLRGMTTISNLVIYDKYEDIKIQFEELEIGLALKEAKKILNEGKFDKLKYITLSGEKVIIQNQDVNQGKMTIENFSIEFDGYLTEKMLEYDPQLIMDYEQQVKLSIDEISVKSGMIGYGISAKDLNKLSRVEEVSFNLKYNPEDEEVNISKMSLITPILEMKGSGRYDLGKDEFDEIIPENIFTEFSMSLTPEGVELGDKEVFGLYSLDSLKIDSNLEFIWDETLPEKVKIVDSTSSFELEGFKARFEGGTKQYLESTPFGQLTGMEMDELAIDRFSFDTKMSDDGLNATSNLLSPLLAADLALELEADGLNDDNPNITASRLTVKDMSQEIRKGVEYLEFMLGQALPREGENIVIEVTGNLNNPKIKGWEF